MSYLQYLSLINIQSKKKVFKCWRYRCHNTKWHNTLEKRERKVSPSSFVSGEKLPTGEFVGKLGNQGKWQFIPRGPGSMHWKTNECRLGRSVFLIRFLAYLFCIYSTWHYFSDFVLFKYVPTLSVYTHFNISI